MLFMKNVWHQEMVQLIVILSNVGSAVDFHWKASIIGYHWYDQKWWWYCIASSGFPRPITFVLILYSICFWLPLGLGKFESHGLKLICHCTWRKWPSFYSYIIIVLSSYKESTQCWQEYSKLMFFGGGGLHCVSHSKYNVHCGQISYWLMQCQACGGIWWFLVSMHCVNNNFMWPEARVELSLLD